MAKTYLLTEEGQRAIRDWLTENDRPAAWLARKIGVSTSHLHHVLARQRPMSEPGYWQIALATQIAIRLMLFGDSQPAEHEEVKL